VCGSVRFRPEQICAVTDSVLKKQQSVRLISINNVLAVHIVSCAVTEMSSRC